MERRLGCALEAESNAKPLVWGKICEGYVNGLLGLEYILTSQETDVHPNYPYWVGSKDVIKHDVGKTVGDIKAPSSRKSFCQLVDPLYSGLQGMDAMNVIRKTHKDGEKYYQQIVSNACINSCKYGELIVFMPYQSELKAIKELAADEDNGYYITNGADCELPYLIEGGYYKNLNIIRFEIPQADRDILEAAVVKHGKDLCQMPSTILITPDTINGSSVLIAEQA